jgi:hypothetical protein
MCNRLNSKVYRRADYPACHWSDYPVEADYPARYWPDYPVLCNEYHLRKFRRLHIYSRLDSITICSTSKLEELILEKICCNSQTKPTPNQI